MNLLQSETDAAKAHRDELLAMHHAQKLRTIGQMTGGFAHEFNNLLAGILGFTELSQEHARERNDERLLSYLNEVERGSVRGSALVRQLLTFSRGNHAQPITVELTQCVAESVELLRATLPATVDIQIQIGQTQAYIMADPEQLKQAIINIGLNAAESMDNKGEIRVSADIAQVNRNCASCLDRIRGTYLVITISDSGGGIQTAPQELFTPFYTTKAIGDGAGLGLSVVHGIIHQYSGHIGIDSSQSGTHVHLYLPLPSVTLRR
jgi:signal transduction histidine kinase